MTVEEWAKEMYDLGDRMNELLKNKPDDADWSGGIINPMGKPYYKITQEIRKLVKR